MVGWMVLGSVPSALVGSSVLHLLGNSKSAESDLEIILGSALLVGAAAVGASGRARAPRRRERGPALASWSCGRCPPFGIGLAGGFIVGIASVGSGSLMIVLLLFLYPMIGANQLVGTDLTQAVPLALAAALGALACGHVEFGVTTSLVIGSVPAVLVGSLISSRAPDRYIRPVIAFVIFASGLKYVGLSTSALGWTCGTVLLAAAVYWLAYARPRQAGALARANRPAAKPTCESTT